MAPRYKRAVPGSPCELRELPEFQQKETHRPLVSRALRQRSDVHLAVADAFHYRAGAVYFLELRGRIRVEQRGDLVPDSIHSWRVASTRRGGQCRCNFALSPFARWPCCLPAASPRASRRRNPASHHLSASSPSPPPQASIGELSRFSKLVKLRAFQPFTSAENALQNINDVSEGILNGDL